MISNSKWRQGSVIEHAVLKTLAIDINKDCVGIVASQSCDIANGNIDQEPAVEVLIAEFIQTQDVDGNLTFNKNPRVLHLDIDDESSEERISKSYFEVKTLLRISVAKDLFFRCSPSETKFLSAESLSALPNWLASRYTRPALPDEFNDRVRKADPKGKLRRKAKSLNRTLIGIYVEILPDREVSSEEHYQVNLLGLLSSSYEGDKSKETLGIEAIKEVLEAAGFDVKSSLKQENEVSIAVIKRFKRLYLDDLSIKGGTELPMAL